MTFLELGALVAYAVLGLCFVIHLRRGSVDSLRIDALQTYQWQVGCIDGSFGVLTGSPPKMVGELKPTVREAIDAAILERNHG